MKITTTKSNFLKESGFRLDATFHLSDGILSKKKIESFGTWKTLSQFTLNIFNGPRFKRYYVKSENKGIPFMGSSDMMKSNIDDLKFISKKLSKNINQLKIKKDWILVSCSGTIGNTVYTNDEFDGKTASQHIMRIVPNNDIKSGFLYSFLSSKYGYGLLTQGTYGAVIQHIEPQHIKSIPIPVFTDEQETLIHNLILKSGRLRKRANNSLKLAIDFFENIIGKSEVKLDFQVGKVSFNSVENFHKRLDAQYQLLWKNLDAEKEDELKYLKISDLAKDIFVGGRGKRMYVEKGVPFLSSSEMMLYNPLRNCKKISKRTKGVENMIVSVGDILISRSGTVGNTVLTGNRLQGSAVSEHALRLIVNPDKISPNYVFCFLRTRYGMKSMEASSFGSVIITLNEDLIGNIKIPIISKENQDKISELIENYLSNMDESVKLENQAIDLVEKEIEEWEK